MGLTTSATADLLLRTQASLLTAFVRGAKSLCLDIVFSCAASSGGRGPRRGNSDCGVSRGARCHAGGQPHCLRDANSHAVTNCHCHGNSDRNRNPHRHPNSNFDAGAVSHLDANATPAVRYGNANPAASAHLHRNPAASARDVPRFRGKPGLAFNACLTGLKAR